MRSGYRFEDEARRAGPWPNPTRASLAAAARVLAEAYPDVEAVYLFGSRAREGSHAGSDVDLAVLLSEAPAEPAAVNSELARFVEDHLGMPAHVILVGRDLHPGLLFDIFVVETILWARDEGRAHEIACRARAEYRDLLPRLDRAFSRVRQRLREHADALNRSRA
jgi:predicted nucleotidyltransferase